MEEGLRLLGACSAELAGDERHLSCFGTAAVFGPGPLLKLVEGRNERGGRPRPVMRGLLVLLGGGSKRGEEEEVIWGRSQSVTMLALPRLF